MFVTFESSHQAMHRKRPHPCKTGHAVAVGRKTRPHGDGQVERWLPYSLRCSAREKIRALGERVGVKLELRSANERCSWASPPQAGGYVKSKVGSCQFADVVQRLCLIDTEAAI